LIVRPVAEHVLDDRIADEDEQQEEQEDDAAAERELVPLEAPPEERPLTGRRHARQRLDVGRSSFDAHLVRGHSRSAHCYGRTVRLPAVLAASTLALVATATAGAKTMPLNWVEHASTTYHPPQCSFGLGWARACKPPAISCALDKVAFTYAKPTVPTSLRPGQTWTGVFGGPGRPLRGKLINVTFGYFQVGGRGFSWITTHAFKL
jgi:hypothetical protein